MFEWITFSGLLVYNNPVDPFDKKNTGPYIARELSQYRATIAYPVAHRNYPRCHASTGVPGWWYCPQPIPAINKHRYSSQPQHRPLTKYHSYPPSRPSRRRSSPAFTSIHPPPRAVQHVSACPTVTCYHCRCTVDDRGEALYDEFVPPQTMSMNLPPTISSLTPTSTSFIRKEANECCCHCIHNKNQMAMCCGRNASIWTVHSMLFLFGFLIFPLWWAGACLFLTDTPPAIGHDDQDHCHYLTRDFRHLNCWMSVLSLLILGVVIALFILWQHNILHYEQD